jgi:hypothetical protein
MSFSATHSAQNSSSQLHFTSSGPPLLIKFLRHPFDCFSHSQDNELARQTISQSQGGDTMGISPSSQREWRPNGQLKQPIQKVGHPSAPPNKPGM